MPLIILQCNYNKEMHKNIYNLPKICLLSFTGCHLSDFLSLWGTGLGILILRATCL